MDETLDWNCFLETWKKKMSESIAACQVGDTLPFFEPESNLSLIDEKLIWTTEAGQQFQAVLIDEEPYWRRVV